MLWRWQKEVIVATSRSLKAWPVGLEGLLISMIRGSPPSLTLLLKANSREESAPIVSLINYDENSERKISDLQRYDGLLHLFPPKKPACQHEEFEVHN